MGQVYRVRHAELGKLFALKVIAPWLASEHDARARFDLEARLASEITHPNIVSVIDFGHDPELGAFMVMELVDGDPLLELAPISNRQALDVLGQIADALEHVHRRGIVHGDVKADNIMLAHEVAVSGTRRRRVVRLLDFGLARRLGYDERDVSGSPHYLAPERAGGGVATVATDIYALGVLGFLLFTGTLPFDGELVEILTAQVATAPPTLSARAGQPIDPAIEKLVATAMAKDPAERHASAAAFRYELNTVMDMLFGSRRRVRGTGSPRRDTPEDANAALFEMSLVPQALVESDGTIARANSAFAALVGWAPAAMIGTPLGDTALARWIPGCVGTVRRAFVGGRSIERRAVLSSSRSLVMWSAPTTLGDQVHVLIHVGEPDAVQS